MIEKTTIFGKKWLITFYKEQLAKFNRLGIGQRTEFDVIVTDRLIGTTKRRLMQLGGPRALFFRDEPIFERKEVKPRTKKQKAESAERVRAFRKRKRLEILERLNGNGQVLQHTSNGSIDRKTSQVDSNKRHDKDKP